MLAAPVIAHERIEGSVEVVEHGDSVEVIR